MKNSKKLIFLLLLLLTIVFIPIFSIYKNTETKQQDLYIKLYFCLRHNCEKAFIDFLSSAENYAYCAFYDLDYKTAKLLRERSKDIDVKLVVDDKNREKIKGNVKYDWNKSLMHNKFCIIDDKAIITGSFNPSYAGFYKNNNNMAIIYSKDLAANYKQEFKELWNNVYGKGNKTKNPKMNISNILIENYFCPEDNCEEHLTNAISSAKKSVNFMVFSFTSEKVANALLFLDKNITIRGIFEAKQITNYSQFNRLKQFGINVKKDRNKYFMHHKVFIIDNQVVVFGSYNPTYSGNFRNDENMLIIHSKTFAKAFINEFNLLFD